MAFNLNDALERFSVTYNGVTVHYPVIREASRVMYSESGRTQKYVLVSFTVTGYVFNEDASEKVLGRMDLIETLSMPGKEFTYYQDNVLVYGIRPVAQGAGDVPGMYDDVLYGPKPEGARIIDNWPYCCRVTFNITAHISPAFQRTRASVQGGLPADGTSPVMDNVIDHTVHVTYSIDENNYTRRTISGHLTVAASFGNWHNDNSNIDRYRAVALHSSRFLARSVANPPENFVRTSQTFTPGEDGATLTYSITDEERACVPPPPCTQFDCSIRLQFTELQFGSCDKFICGTYTLPPRADAYAACIRLMRRVFTNYIISDPENAIVYVQDWTLERTSVERNTWAFSFHCLHHRSMLFDNAFLYSGLFGNPLNEGTKYNHPTIYGAAGLSGDGYNAGKFSALQNVSLPNERASSPTNLPSLRPNTRISEPGVAMFNEKAEVFIIHRGSLQPTQSGTYAARDVTKPAMFIAVAGYKVCVRGPNSNRDSNNNGDNDMRMVTPSLKFNILNPMQGTEAADPLIPAANGMPAKLPAVIVAQKYGGLPPTMSKLNDSKLYVMKYQFCVLLSQWIYDKLAAQLATEGGTVDMIPWPTSLDGIADEISRRVGFSDTHRGATATPTTQPITPSEYTQADDLPPESGGDDIFAPVDGGFSGGGGNTGGGGASGSF